jgi:hypothetical protein
MPGHEDSLFVDSVPHEAFKCMICLLTANDPVLICTNQHLFCRSCISLWLAQQPRCPGCNEGLTVGALKTHRLAADYIGDCCVRCEFSLMVMQENVSSVRNRNKRLGARSAAGGGCDWVGRICEVDQHKNNCKYVEVVCRHGGGCEWKGRRGDANEHENRKCVYRKKACQHCNEDCTLLSMKSHVRGCRRRPVVCTNTMCGISYPHEDLEEHLKVCHYSTIFVFILSIFLILHLLCALAFKIFKITR